jgi:hypothetical protein
MRLGYTMVVTMMRMRAVSVIKKELHEGQKQKLDGQDRVSFLFAWDISRLTVGERE